MPRGSGTFIFHTVSARKSHHGHATQKRDIVLKAMSIRIISLADDAFGRRSPEPASGPEVGLWRPSCPRAMQGMCGVLATPPDAFASVPGLVAALPQVILMRGAQGSSTSQPQQLDLSSGCANVHESWITAK